MVDCKEQIIEENECMFQRTYLCIRSYEVFSGSC